MKIDKTDKSERSGMEKDTVASQEVFDYYEKNWRQIVACYDIGADGLPCDPAFYRRLIYLRILREMKVNNILDVGCGSGRTVLDALQMNREVKGIEPIGPLMKAAKVLLVENGQNPDLIEQNEIFDLKGWEADTFDTVAVLSVLPHVCLDKWDLTHQYLVRLIKKGGYFIASYRNDLFDLFTFNSFTIDFIVNSLWDCEVGQPLKSPKIVSALKGLIRNPDIPGPFHTCAKDKTFGKLTRINSNPLEMTSYLSRFGLEVLKTYFYNYHCVPPLLDEANQDFRTISHKMDMEMVEDWRGNFLASTFVILSRKP
ncbi:MAG: class I SAM-dependent methyltransferase [Thermodesulfobacteriota bacterium]|jgi:2-polyprenyl-3-methyl-5-hydroxy-6-metoxy-1,4-benzoquinol methylase